MAELLGRKPKFQNGGIPSWGGVVDSPHLFRVTGGTQFAGPRASVGIGGAVDFAARVGAGWVQ